MKSTDLDPGSMRLPGGTDGDTARRRRDRELTMSERLQRLHHLCAQLARVRPIKAKRPE
jgi:hypothetical protein